MPTVLIIERDDKAMRLLAWGMREEGYKVVTSAGADELVTGERVLPDVIVFNTAMPMDVKRLWVSSLRHIVRDVDVIDLRTAGDSSTYDTGADGYLEPPYRIEALVTLIGTLRAGRTTNAVSAPDGVLP